MKPLIGITTGEIINKLEPWESHVYGQKNYYSDAVIAAGGIPIFIPFMPNDELKDLYDRLDGIIFAGGNDINPKLYDEAIEPHTVEISTERDRVETHLMSWTLRDDKPLLAICRGFQLLNVHLGGSLYQDIATNLVEASNHNLSTQKKDGTYIAHILRLDPESRLARITGSTSMKANTHHHQGVKRIADELRVSAWSEDGLVEGLEHPAKRFALGVQCHPESLYPSDEKWATVFREFIASTNAHAKTRS